MYLPASFQLPAPEGASEQRAVLRRCRHLETPIILASIHLTTSMCVRRVKRWGAGRSYVSQWQVCKRRCQAHTQHLTPVHKLNATICGCVGRALLVSTFLCLIRLAFWPCLSHANKASAQPSQRLPAEPRQGCRKAGSVLCVIPWLRRSVACAQLDVCAGRGAPQQR